MKNKLRAFFRNNPSSKVKPKDIAKHLSIEEAHEYSQLKAMLHKLTKEGFIEKVGKRYVLATAGDGKLIGTLQLVRSGEYGFVILHNSNLNDIYVKERNLATAFDGDTVEVSLFAKQKGKNLEGQVTNVVKRKKEEITGTIKRTRSFFFLEPDDESFPRDFYVAEENLNGAKHGDKVVIGSIEWHDHHLNPEGRVIEVIGKAGSYDTEIHALAKEFELDYKFPDRVIEEAGKISENIPEDEIKKRLDLRKETVITIDPDTAKDFDDAVSIDKLDNGNYRVGIHIADVSHYVKDGSAIYEEALKRGTSVYFVGQVVPMLPERLSNNICSLVPNKDRLTFSVIAELTSRGKLVDYEIHKSIINSKRRFTYDEVQKIIESGKGELNDKILMLNKISKTLRNNRFRKGSINFVSPEVEFTLDENGTPVAVDVKKSNESHNLIEELMLLANQVVATHVNRDENKTNVPFVYRVHDLPDPEKLEEFAGFVKTLGYSFDPQAAKKPKHFQKLFEAIKDSPEEALVNEVAIRSMAKAVYSTHNIGHYGLAFKYYTHFTSPIRRFPDLIVHKALFYFMNNSKQDKYPLHELDDIADHCSAQERNAVNAERLSVKIKQIEFLKNKLGEEFEAVISGVTHFGMFVELKETLAQGLVHVRDMDNDFYIHDEKNYSLIGESKQKVYKLGDKVNVKLVRVNEEKRVLDFILIE